MISFWFWLFCYCLVCCVLCFVSSYIHSLENNIFEEGTKKETSLAVTTQRNRIFYWVLYNRSSHSILTPTRPKMSTHRQQQQQQQEITSPWCVFNCALWVTGKKSPIQWKKQEKKPDSHFQCSFLCNIVQDVVFACAFFSYLLFTFFFFVLHLVWMCCIEQNKNSRCTSTFQYYVPISLVSSMFCCRFKHMKLNRSSIEKWSSNVRPAAANKNKGYLVS